MGEAATIGPDVSQPILVQQIGQEEIRSSVSWDIRYFSDVSIEEIVRELNQDNVQPKILSIVCSSHGVRLMDVPTLAKQCEAPSTVPSCAATANAVSNGVDIASAQSAAYDPGARIPVFSFNIRRQ